MEHESHHELLGLVARHATRDGRTDSAHPGVWFWRRDRSPPRQRSTTGTLTLAVIVQGTKVVEIDGHSLAYDALRYLVLTGETQFDSVVTEAIPERPYLSLGVAMPPELVAKTLAALAEVEAVGTEEPAPAFVARLDAGMLDTLCRLLRTIDEPAELAVLTPLIIEELVFRLLRSDGAATLRRAVGRGDAVRIEETMAFIRAHVTARLSVDDLARRVAMSPSHFAHRFRAVARLSPMRYVKHVRMHEARALLLRGARASEVAQRVGYASASHFTRDFKGQFGVTPAAYARGLQPAAPA